MRKIIVVGAGALGSHVTLFMRDFDMKRAVPSNDLYGIVAIDFDRVEQKNTLSQFHSKGTIGKNKALALQQSLNFLFGIKIDAIPHKLTLDNVEKLLGGAALVIDCLDNGASRLVIQAFVRRNGLPCLHGALAADGTVGGVIWDDKFQIDYEDGEGGATCEDGANLPFIGMVAAQLARSAQEFLTTGQQRSFRIFSRAASISL